ncbi:MobC family replication-relaxation protein [Dickeya solani]|uniref:MobC family replication-relaxation protein n=1 Tax=Dickeya solani TaxID=1089444 RepID=A0ABU4EFZ3_9GAMM|nr:MobC family replication-relaxation protein [Dickeya solani]MCA6998435.1 molybdopterin-guanine dinucleotide biosynthesis protein MobC [Dickeya solani]MCZ0823851.1 molybdopterin-guanine dinucleotide biosynthesis protein MobC [Dickeya solani]MDV6997560.1 MobC family replication-relaxation protein [Dickeya solani]MDV7006443.1 MobC family replication-relaxation protein [Dickeya solani]MDV7037861.1 MobC family replication-relaxation protein [Dickeya solani]
MLIHNVAERNKSAKQRMRALLYFLKEETFSDFRTLKRVVGYKGKYNHAMYNLLNKAVAMGLLNKHEYPVLTGKKSLWGITMQGLAMVVSANDKVFPAYFEPGKLRQWTLEHRLLNQRVRIALEEKGGTGWLNGDRGEFIARYTGVRHRPDGIITLGSGAIVAVETERTMKTRARYISIINSHLAASDAGRWYYAMYVMPDDKTKESLIRLFGSIRTVTRNSVPVPFDAKNREMFLFRTIDELEESISDKQEAPSSSAQGDNGREYHA